MNRRKKNAKKKNYKGFRIVIQAIKRGKWPNLFDALIIPLRSRVRPINAYFTISDRNTASDVDPKLTDTLNEHPIIVRKTLMQKRSQRENR